MVSTPKRQRKGHYGGDRNGDQDSRPVRSQPAQADNDGDAERGDGDCGAAGRGQAARQRLEFRKKCARFFS
jgi:hypothetical protein